MTKYKITTNKLTSVEIVSLETNISPWQDLSNWIICFLGGQVESLLPFLTVFALEFGVQTSF